MTRRPRILGICNVTPDSFSDGGRYLEPAAAIAHGRSLFAQGADIVDVGGESTRPGAVPVPADEELRRVLPVVEALAAEGPVSIDTTKPEVARAAVAVGASIINDVSAGLWAVAAETGAGWIAMHRKGDPATMQDDPRYDDVVAEVADHLTAAAERARAAGVGELWIDPGLGFGKTDDHNLVLLAHLDTFVALGHPVAIGASRKRTLAELLRRSDGTEDLPAPEDRLEGSVAAAVWAVCCGVDLVRVHDVAATAQAVRLVVDPPDP